MSREQESDSKSKLIHSLSNELIQRAVEQIAVETGENEVEIRAQLTTYINEGSVALRMVNGYLQRENQRILEVGGGIGFVSRSLNAAGYDVVDLEPSGKGFGFMTSARRALSDSCSAPHLNIGIDELTPREHGMFDLIYSVNVLEHVPDPISALTRMYSALNPGGKIVIMCPNYSLPFEPHFSIPLIPVRPSLTAKFLPTRVTASEVWQSLNWIKAAEVEAWSKMSGAELEFKKSVIAEMCERIAVDRVFRERHRILGICVRSLRSVGLIRLLSLIPPQLASPMQFEITRPLSRSAVGIAVSRGVR